MFETFTLSMINTGEVTLRVRHGGDGPPLLLLHGHPRTHVMWHKIAPMLATEFTVIAPDLRGYGQSSKPPTTPNHEPYSKRAMARDQIALMQQLGFTQFFVVGHDRGGRVAYRLTLDYPDHVLKLAVLDILPTLEHWERADKTFMKGWWHWAFLAQPYDLPERMIGADPDYFYWRRHGQTIPDFIDPEAFEDYRLAFTNPQTIHAMCEDYRAGATIDIEIDKADRAVKRIGCPLLALWSRQNDLEKWYDVVGIWREWADTVQGKSIDCGHHLAEEAPEETYQALRDFFIC